MDGHHRMVDPDDSSPLHARSGHGEIHLGVHRLLDPDDSSPLQRSRHSVGIQLGRLTETEEMEEVPFHMNKLDTEDCPSPSPTFNSGNSYSLIISAPPTPNPTSSVVTPSADPNRPSSTSEGEYYVV